MKIDFTKMHELYRPQVAQVFRPAAATALDKEQQERQQLRNTLREYQENTRQAEQLKVSICKGMKCGTPPDELLLDAVRCIGLLTGDGAFYEQVAADAAIVQDLQNGTEAAAVADKQHRLHLMKRCIDAELEKLLPDENKKNGKRG